MSKKSSMNKKAVSNEVTKAPKPKKAPLKKATVKPAPKVIRNMFGQVTWFNAGRGYGTITFSCYGYGTMEARFYGNNIKNKNIKVLRPNTNVMFVAIINNNNNNKNKKNKKYNNNDANSMEITNITIVKPFVQVFYGYVTRINGHYSEIILENTSDKSSSKLDFSEENRLFFDPKDCLQYVQKGDRVEFEKGFDDTAGVFYAYNITKADPKLTECYGKISELFVNTKDNNDGYGYFADLTDLNKRHRFYSRQCSNFGKLNEGDYIKYGYNILNEIKSIKKISKSEVNKLIQSGKIKVNINKKYYGYISYISQLNIYGFITPNTVNSTKNKENVQDFYFKINKNIGLKLYDFVSFNVFDNKLKGSERKIYAINVEKVVKHKSNVVYNKISLKNSKSVNKNSVNNRSQVSLKSVGYTDSEKSFIGENSSVHSMRSSKLN